MSIFKPKVKNPNVDSEGNIKYVPTTPSQFLYAVRDKEAGVYLPPVVLTNNVTALRSFERQIKAGDSSFSEYPDQFELVRIGSFNEHTGEVESHPIIRLAGAEDYIKDDDKNKKEV